MSHDRQFRDARVKSTAKGLIEVRAVVYGVVDDYRSVFLPGCFNGSLARRLPVICWAHSWNEPIGRGTGWREDATSLLVTARLDNDDRVPQAQRAIAQIESGTLTDVSVGFSNVQRRRLTQTELIRWPGAEEVIETADLDEVSIVLRGAVPGAELLSMRAARGGSRVSAFEQGLLDRLYDATYLLATEPEHRDRHRRSVQELRAALGWD